MAREFPALFALVAGIDITYYLRQIDHASEDYVYPVADFLFPSGMVETPRLQGEDCSGMPC
jgi:hypothetical protein